MGGGYAQEVVASETIIEKNGHLFFDRGIWINSVPVRVAVNGHWVTVGCHRISLEAWDVLKRFVEAKR